MKQKSSTYILRTTRLIAILCGVIGIFYLIRNFRQHLYIFTGMFSDKYQGIDPQIWFVIFSICTLLILILRPIAGFGLFTLKSWSRKLTIGVLSADFIIRAITFINFHTFSLRHPEIYNEMNELLASGVKPTHIYSMIPSYIIALISLISVIFLIANRKSKMLL